MATQRHTAWLLGAVLLSTVCGSGCMQQGFHLGPLAFPIPISPYFQDRKEDEWWIKERYDRAPVLGPIPAGGPCVALDVPSDDEVMRTLERAQPVEGGIPFLHQVQRNNVRITKVKISDYVDPPRVYPLIGPAQLHHAHYKCTVYFTEVKRVGWPLPHTLRDEDSQEVVYIDHNHLHMVGNVDCGPNDNYTDGHVQ